jgi:hypothetical protein
MLGGILALDDPFCKFGGRSLFLFLHICARWLALSSRR